MTTTNYSLGTPADGSRGWDLAVNENLDTIASAIDTIRENNRQVTDALANVNSTAYRPVGFNMGFDFWQRGTGPFTSTGSVADMWTFTIQSGSASLSRADGDSMDSTYMASTTIDTNGDQFTLANDIPYSGTLSNFHKFCRGKTVTFAVDTMVSTDHADTTWFIQIDDGDTTSDDSGVFSASSTVERRLLTHSVSASSTKLEVSITLGTASGTSKVVSVANASFAVGNFASLPYRPLNPQRDFMGCCAVYQQVGFDIGWYNRSTTVDVKRSLNYPFPMLGTPSGSVVAGSAYGSLTTSTFDFVPESNTTGYIHLVSSGGTGDVGSTGNVIVLEVT